MSQVHADSTFVGPPVPRGNVLSALGKDVQDRVERVGADNTTVVFLGDNVYPDGLEPLGHPNRYNGERVLNLTLAALGSARGIFVMGNHDWERLGADGYDHVVSQARYLESQPYNVEVHPPAGCPGPTHVDIGRQVRFVFMDPAAWNYWYQRQQDPSGCGIQFADIAGALQREFENPGDRYVIYASHYPMVSAGPHGGKFTWKEHIFPLRDKNPKLWIPLPVIGSIYVLWRQRNPATGDIPSDPYQAYISAVSERFGRDAPRLSAAGHEHSLQVHETAGLFHIVSGGGSTDKITPVRKRKSGLLLLSRPGYMRIDVFEDGSIGLTVITVRKEEPSPVFEIWLERAD
jgi:hypothetical protein